MPNMWHSVNVFLLCFILLDITLSSSKPTDIVIVVHSTSQSNHEEVTNYSISTWLAPYQHVVVTGEDVDNKIEVIEMHRRELYKVSYNGNPGCSDCSLPSYLKRGKMFGAHRSIAGTLIAYDKYPDAKWIIVIEDDNYFDVVRTISVLESLDHNIPLLLASVVSPSSVSCNEVSSGKKWSCCTKLDSPCIVDFSDSVGKQGVYKFDSGSHSMKLDKHCQDDEVSEECCQTKPWPQGIMYGFRYRLAFNGTATYRPHFATVWPSGGSGYILSRELIGRIGRDNWEECMYAYQCNSAEIRVSMCAINHGFSVTKADVIIGLKHRLHTPQEMEAAIKGNNAGEGPQKHLRAPI